MASSARIDELRKKFDENPRRYFAPLANEYRKAGDLDQAIFICQEYLPQQPGHMSGHIVYAQTLYEMGRHEEAKAVFETALSLDPENLIALRHLGDIARQAGDSNAARIWYQRVLEADPRNEEIAQIMISLLAEPAPALGRPTPAVPAAPLKTPVLTPAVTPPAESTVAPVLDAAPTGGMAVEKSEDKTELAASSKQATTAPQPAAAADEPEDGHEWLDLNDLTIGGVAMGSTADDAGGANESHDPYASGRGTDGSAQGTVVPFSDEFSDAFPEPFGETFDEPESAIESFDGSAVAPVHDEGGFDLGREDGPFEEDPFAIAATPDKRPAAASEPETSVEARDDVQASEDLSDDALHEEAPAAVDGLEQFEAGFMTSPPVPTVQIETASFFEATPEPETPAASEAASAAVNETANEAANEAVSEAANETVNEAETEPADAVAESPSHDVAPEPFAVASSAAEPSAVESPSDEVAAETPVAESEFAEAASVEATSIEPAPESAQTDVAEVPAAVEEAFVTETMAELYLRQGHLESAMDIYRKLVEQRPTDDRLRSRLHAVETQIVAAQQAEADETHEPAPEWTAESEAPAVAHAGPTIREFLVGLTGGRRWEHADQEEQGEQEGEVNASNPIAADEMTEAVDATDVAAGIAVADALDSVAVPLEAYRSLPTPVFNTPVSGPTRRATPNPGDTVSGSIDALFSDADASAADAAAAATLAEAFAPASLAAMPLHGVPAHRATNELSLDHVFKSSTTPRSDVETDGFSFDQFFADDMSEPAPNSAGDAGAPSTEATDDIAQFNAWLNGLKKT
jgi:tetratricopeptide (TPR) repeat protein